jgi:uncharacterized damage-inducible protein DinB
MDRTDPDLRADERTTILQFLDYHRATLEGKAAGLTAAQMGQTLAPSDLTMAGLVKHLALVEDSWFQEVLLGRPLPEPWHSAPFDDDPDWELHSAPDDDPADLLALYRDACERSRAAVEEVGDLAALSVKPSKHGDGQFSLRWILLHMIEETARHNGHADFLRQSIDGETGE